MGGQGIYKKFERMPEQAETKASSYQRSFSWGWLQPPGSATAAIAGPQLTLRIQAFRQRQGLPDTSWRFRSHDFPKEIHTYSLS